ncbi:MAG: hypothetical protein OXG82_16905 [Gammaproteobacteria bacterium]|nr:hypothetical protein [Gammaproteobacteria bacterium]
MTLHYYNEPRLAFAEGEHICPRRGIATYGVFDRHSPGRHSAVNIGTVGTSSDVDKLSRWLERCSLPIEGPQETPQPNLFPPFPGVNRTSAFFSDFVLNSANTRELMNKDVKAIQELKSREERINKAVDLYFEDVRFLAQNRHVDVVVCVVPEDLHRSIASAHPGEPVDEELEDESSEYFETNFRRALKARSMHLGRPLQLMRSITLDPSAPQQQDEATKAWNFCTAMYYKSGPKIPWKLTKDPNAGTSCGIGVAFYRSRDYEALGTSLAQVFDDLGNGLILRGTPVDLSRDDRRPHLSVEQSYDLILAALRQYRIALRTFPARVVVHKSSHFSDEEIEGCTVAASESGIDWVDFVSVMDSSLNLYRGGNYPPFRGTAWELDSLRAVLYTRGSVWYYGTYPGMYVPTPIELDMQKTESSPSAIVKEVLRFTKLNWNNTQFDGKYPVTLGCARKVGQIMKYLDDDEVPQIRYAYYM